MQTKLTSEIYEGTPERIIWLKAEHKEIVYKIRELYTESGGKLLYLSEQFGFNEYFCSTSGLYEVDFDYGLPQSLWTPEGKYEILGSNVEGDLEKFWRLFNAAFEVTILQPKRDDKRVRENKALDYYTSASGPIVAIKMKQ